MSNADLQVINQGRALWHLALHFALIALLSLASYHVSLLFLILLGPCLGALFPLMHEATHRHIFTRPWPNAILAFGTGAVLLLPAAWFRHFHAAHHRYTQDPARDPELARPRPRTPAAYLWHLSGVPTWVSSLRLLARHCVADTADPFVPPRKHTTLVWQARAILTAHLLLIVAGTITAPRGLLVLYGGLIWGQVLLRAFLLVEHGGLPFVDQVLDNTRTTRAAGWLRWLTWNMSFHVEHHSNPAVPYDKLPALHARLQPDTCASYLRFHRWFWQRTRGGSDGL